MLGNPHNTHQQKSYLVHKAPTFVRMGEVVVSNLTTNLLERHFCKDGRSRGKQPYNQFIGEADFQTPVIFVGLISRYL